MNKLLCYRVSIVIVLYLGYVFYNLTRKSMSFMMPHFASNTHSNSSNSLNITKNDMGIIISSQNLAYALSKFFFGILSDIASCRVLFGSGLFLSGLLNIGMRKEIQTYNLYVLSFLIGLAQGPAWPACAKIIKNWFPKEQFGTWWSIVSTGTNIAGTLGPIAATFIALHYHWSIGFMILGCICMSVGYISILLLRNKPSDVGLKDCNDENDDIPDVSFPEYQSSGEEDEEEPEEISRIDQIKMMLKYPFFVAVCLVFFIVQLTKTIYCDVSQVYLIKTIKVDPFTASHFLSVFEFGGIFGTIFSGLVTDAIFIRLNRRKDCKVIKTPINIRFILVLIYMVILILCTHLFNYHVKIGVNKNFLLAVGFLVGTLSYGSLSLLGVMSMEFTSNEYSGTSHSIATFAANVGAIFAGLPFSIISRYYTWNFAFRLVEYFSYFTLLFLFIFRNSNKQFVPITSERKKQ